MRRAPRIAAVASAVALAALAGSACTTGSAPQEPASTASEPVAASTPSTMSESAEPQESADPSTSTPDPTPEASTESSPQPRPPARRRLPDDARWLYFESDETAYASPWWRGRHRLQIAFGCTPAPYYVLDSRCEGSGYHHGYDFAIPCGTPLRAARPARVLSSASLGPAYGENALLLRMTDDEGVERDVVIGHTRRNRVVEGDRIRRGEVFAVVSDSAVYTGCHLHFEVRAAGGSVSTAVDPRPLLELRPRRGEL